MARFKEDSRLCFCLYSHDLSGRFPAAMTAENPDWGKLTELMPHHIFSNVNAPEIPAVVDEKCLGDEFRNDRTGTSPGLDGSARAISCHYLLV